MAVKAMEQLGHQVIDWKPTPPTHKEIVEIGVTCWDFDGGATCTSDSELSGEEAAPQTLVTRAPQANATDIMAASVKKRDIQKEYMEYWNSTAKLTDSGRSLDCISCPVASFPLSIASATYLLDLSSLRSRVIPHIDGILESLAYLPLIGSHVPDFSHTMDILPG